MRKSDILTLGATAAVVFVATAALRADAGRQIPDVLPEIPLLTEPPQGQQIVIYGTLKDHYAALTKATDELTQARPSLRIDTSNLSQTPSEAQREALNALLDNRSTFQFNGDSLREYLAKIGHALGPLEQFGNIVRHGKVIEPSGVITRRVPTTRPLPGIPHNDIITNNKELSGKWHAGQEVNWNYEMTESWVENGQLNTIIWAVSFDNSIYRIQFHALEKTVGDKTTVYVKRPEQDVSPANPIIE